MSDLYPLRFHPIYKRYLWGGRRLQTVLGKDIPDGDDVAESWEVVDHGADQSVVRCGPLQGATLRDLVASRGEHLLGRHWPQQVFPLLFKFLDCNRSLSVQVHPDDRQAALLDPPDSGKTEAWVILHAEPGAKLFAGLKAGVDRQTLAAAMERGEMQQCLHVLTPRAGDCVFIPAGVVHALGAGLIVAEIQQSSDTTYRLFDWNRLDDQGRPRELHVAQALEAINFDYGPAAPQEPVQSDTGGAERLVSCDKFVLDRWKLTEPAAIGGDGICRIVAVVDGEVSIAGDPEALPLVKGDTALLPASLPQLPLHPEGETKLLVAQLP